MACRRCRPCARARERRGRVPRRAGRPVGAGRDSRALLRVRRAENRLQRSTRSAFSSRTRSPAVTSSDPQLSTHVSRDRTATRRSSCTTRAAAGCARHPARTSRPSWRSTPTTHPRWHAHGRAAFDERSAGIVPLVAYGTGLGALTARDAVRTARACSSRSPRSPRRRSSARSSTSTSAASRATLQAGLLPDVTAGDPRVPSRRPLHRRAGPWTSAATSTTSSSAGEDWVLVIGDVCGKGPEAAAVTGSPATRSARSAAPRAPERVLAALNARSCRGGDARFVTAVRPLGRDGACGPVRRPPAGRSAARRRLVEERRGHRRLLGLLPTLRIPT